MCVKNCIPIVLLPSILRILPTRSPGMGLRVNLPMPSMLLRLCLYLTKITLNPKRKLTDRPVDTVHNDFIEGILALLAVSLKLLDTT